MDTARVFSGDHAYVPTRYRVRLNPQDAQALDGYVQTVETELADALHARARARGYRLLARPTVSIEASPRIQLTDIDVIADVIDQRAIDGGSEPDGGRPARGRHGTGVFGAAGLQAAPAVAPGWADQPRQQSYEARPVEAAASFPMPAQAPLPIQQPPMPIQPPMATPAPLMARVELRTRGVFMGACEFRGGTARIGRGTDNEIVLVDDRVSRRHGQLSARQGNLVFIDLGSTNGSFVNGTRVREIVLGSGDVVRLGNSTLTIQPRA